MRTFIILTACLLSTTLFANQQISLSAKQVNNLGIKVSQLQTIQSVPLLNASAKVSIPPVNEHFVSAAYSGLVNQIKLSVGDQVKKNQTLATLKSAELLTLQQQHLRSMNDLLLAKADFTRDEQLHKEGVIADRRWLTTKTNFQVATAHLNETQQLLEMSGVSKKEIKTLEKTRQLSSQLNITAPISGVLLERMVTAGERVDALTPLFRVANLETLWLDISIPQQHIAKIQVGDKVIVSGLDAQARIFLLAKSVNEANQTILVRAKITETQGNIRLGQTVNVKVTQSSEQLLFQVPNSALAQSEGIIYLFVRNADGFTAMPVQVQGKDAGKTIISAANINKNSEIAITGAVALKANLLGLGGDE